jgi:uncharacterized protein (DUF1684 family)
MKHLRLLIPTLLMVVSCTKLGQAPIPVDYDAQLEAWKQARIASLTAPTGWMRLSDMLWLDEGANPFMGDTLYLSDQRVLFADSLVYDATHAPLMENGDIRWTIIKRGDLIGARVWNTVNADVDAFTGFERYPTDTNFVRRARFKANRLGTTIPIVNILGQTDQIPSPGILHFDLDGKSYTLDALDGGDRMFIILGDATNRTETYQAGRYMYIDYPEDGSSETVIDFNKAYNPPCAFSPYTTCQFPPKQNVLPVDIRAGEKRVK